MRIFMYVFGFVLAVEGLLSFLGIVNEGPSYTFAILPVLGLIMMAIGEILVNQKKIIEKLNEKK